MYFVIFLQKKKLVQSFSVIFHLMCIRDVTHVDEKKLSAKKCTKCHMRIYTGASASFYPKVHRGKKEEVEGNFWSASYKWQWKALNIKHLIVNLAPICTLKYVLFILTLCTYKTKDIEKKVNPENGSFLPSTQKRQAFIVLCIWTFIFILVINDASTHLRAL